MEIRLNGIGVSPGIAVGPVLPFGVRSLDIPKYPVEDKAAELKRFERAIKAVRRDLQRLHEQTAQELGRQHADIFKAHLMMLEDVALREEIEARLNEEGFNIEYLIDDQVARYSKVLEGTDDPQFKERTKDFVDVGTRVLGKLLNTELGSLEQLDHPCVIVAHDLSPSDTANIDLVNALGLATDVGGPTSHTAILARAFEIPAVVGLKYVGSHALPDDTIIIDGTRGLVVIRPTEETLAQFVEQKKRVDATRSALLSVEEERQSVTLDGQLIPTMANIELPVEISHSLKAHAQGIGLYRTEYLFLSRNSLPSEEQQYEAYAEVASALAPAPVTLRTLDLGGDKFASHLPFAEEINPQLGWRAIRFCLERPDILIAQLRAMLRASAHGNVQIMFPLISGVDEFRRVMAIFREVCDNLEQHSIPFDKNIRVGTMIEVPSAVMLADVLAKECDFFSIGTNDLIQYSLAVDRVNEKIAHMYEPAHPAVLRMIRLAAKAARTARIPCGICGEMAGDPLYTELLIGLGVNSFSMSAVAIPVVRAEITNVRMSVAKRFARKVLALSTVEEVKTLLQKRQEGRQTLEAYLEKAVAARKGSADDEKRG